MKNILLRKFVTTKKINKGVSLKKNNINTALTFKKGGIHPKDYYKIINKKAKKDLKKGHVLSFADIK